MASRTCWLHSRLTPAERAEVLQFCCRLGLTISALLRLLLRVALAEPGWVRRLMEQEER